MNMWVALGTVLGWTRGLKLLPTNQNVNDYAQGFAIWIWRWRGIFKNKRKQKELISINECSNWQHRMCTKYSQPRNANIMKFAWTNATENKRRSKHNISEKHNREIKRNLITENVKSKQKLFQTNNYKHDYAENTWI